MEYLDADTLAGYLGDYTKYFAIFGAAYLGYKALKVGCKALRLTVRTIRRSFEVDLQKYGRWAVITGCTDGIGKSYAFQMAEKGMDIVLISRSPEKLAQTAREIGERAKVHVKVIAADFKRTDIYEHIRKELDGLDIGILVNNVGMAHPQGPIYFAELPDFEQYNFDVVNVNIMSYVMMTSIVLPEMLERKRGLIINIGSGAGIRPLSFYTTYCASKAFIAYFSEALSVEYAPLGVTVQLVMPNMVVSNMTKTVTKYGGMSEGLFFPSSDVFVKKAIQTIGHESVTGPHWPHELQQLITPWFSNAMMRKVLLTQRNKVLAAMKKD